MRQKAIDMGLIPKDFVCGDYRMDPQGTGFVGPAELQGLQRTFNLYVENPKQMFGEIEQGESFTKKGNQKFFDLASDYQMSRFGRTSFVNSKSDKDKSNLVESRG